MSTTPVSSSPVEGEMTAHTPGPWQWEKTQYGAHFASLRGQNGDPVIFSGEYAAVSWMEVSDVDADLIAAAPDLYLAAKRLLSAFDELRAMTNGERIIVGRSNAEIRKASDEAMADLRDAARRAEGRDARKDGA